MKTKAKTKKTESLAKQETQKKLLEIVKLSSEILEVRDSVVHKFLDASKETNIEVIAYADAAQVALLNARLFLDRMYVAINTEQKT